MINDIQEGSWRSKGDAIRCAKSLGRQIKADHEEMTRLWKKSEKMSLDTKDEEEMGRALAWLICEIGLYRKLGNRGIEGILMGGMDEIEKDVIEKEKKIIEKINDDHVHGGFAPIPASNRDGVVRIKRNGN